MNDITIFYIFSLNDTTIFRTVIFQHDQAIFLEKVLYRYDKNYGSYSVLNFFIQEDLISYCLHCFYDK